MVYLYIDKELGEEISNEYYQNEQQKIRKLVDLVLFKLKFLDVNVEDFYSLADEVFCDTLKRYDGKQDFNGFLYSCLMNKFKTEMTRRNRYKRTADRMSVSLNSPIGDDKEYTLSDIIADKSTIEKEIFEEKNEGYSDKMNKYLGRLSVLQKEVLRLISIGFSPGEIMEELHINQRMYADCYDAINSYRNKKILF